VHGAYVPGTAWWTNATRPHRTLAKTAAGGNDCGIEAPMSHTDVTTTIEMVADIRDHLSPIRQILEEDDGEEKVDEDDT
jgi:hypothetical protein